MWQHLMGKKIVAFRGYPSNSGHSRESVDLSYILFDDGETYIELSEQDMDTYHDCSRMARLIQVRRDARVWQFLKDGLRAKEPTTSCFF